MSSANLNGAPTPNSRAQELTKLLGREAVESVLNSKQESLLSGGGRQCGRAHHLELPTLIQHETGDVSGSRRVDEVGVHHVNRYFLKS